MAENLPAPGPSDLRESVPRPAGHWDADGGFDALTQVNWRRYVAAVLRYKWLVLAIVVVSAVVGVGLSRLVATRYQAEATIWIEGGAGGEAGAGPIQPTQLLRSQAWVDLLKSYLVLDHVVLNQRLYIDIETSNGSDVAASFDTRDSFIPGEYEVVIAGDGRSFRLLQDDLLLQHGQLGDSIGVDVGFAWVIPEGTVPPGEEIRIKLDNPRGVATRLAERLRADMEENGTFLRLRLQDHSPQRVAAVLNAIADRYVAVAAELKGDRVVELTKLLDEQLDRALNRLQDAETALESFRVSTITLPSEPATPVNPGLESTSPSAVSSFFDLKIQQEQVRQDRQAIQRVLDMVPDSGLVVEALEVLMPVRNASELLAALQELTSKRAELRALRYSYTESYRPVRQLAEEIEVLEGQTVPQLATALVSELEAREAELDRLIGSASGELQQIPPRAIEEARLERHVAAAENIYTMVQQRYEEARLAAASTIPDIRILDAAVVPRQPMHDTRRIRLIFMALMAGFGLGLAGAVLLDRIDPRVRYPEQVTEELGIPILGAVPLVRERGGRLNEADAAQVVEAFRSIRLGLTHAYGTAGPVVLTVTSPGSQDGKSFVTSNLAISFAELGKRTVVVDADTRRGGLHRRLNGVRRPGLTDYLADRVSRDEILQRAVYGSVDLIASGTRYRSGPELLQSAQMTALLARLRLDYDVIVIDSPPLGAGIDPFVCGTATGNLLLVLRTGSSDRALLAAKLEALDYLPIRLLGAVLNGVSADGAYRYYRHYQYYSYMPGYEAYDEDVSASSLKRLVGTVDRAAGHEETAGHEEPDPNAPGRASNPAPQPSDEPRRPPEGEGPGPATAGGSVPDPSSGRASPGGNPGSQSVLSVEFPAGGNAPRTRIHSALERWAELHRDHQKRNQVRQWR
jgi:capsular exopolysaccharide synthesis family protein